MVKKSVEILIEGGNAADEPIFRKAWQQFFTKLGLLNKPRVFASKARWDAFDDFKNSFKRPNPKVHYLLLVDSEDALLSQDSIQNLTQRDGWQFPEGAKSDDVFLMVRSMETWLLADTESLAKHYGGCFDKTKIPNWANLENVAREHTFAALQAATQNCKGGYAKGAASFRTLESIDPTKVHATFAELRRLKDRIQALIP